MSWEFERLLEKTREIVDLEFLIEPFADRMLEYYVEFHGENSWEAIRLRKIIKEIREEGSYAEQDG